MKDLRERERKITQFIKEKSKLVPKPPKDSSSDDDVTNYLDTHSEDKETQEKSQNLLQITTCEDRQT